MKTGNGHASNGVERDLLSPSAKAALLNKEAEGDKQRPRDEDILKVLPEAVYVTDADGRITFFNEAAVSLWGARPELGKSEFCRTWKLYRPDGTPVPPEESPAAFALKQKLPVRGDKTVAERPDGSRVAFIPSSTPLVGNTGTIVGSVNVLMDVTELEASEQRRPGRSSGRGIRHTGADPRWRSGRSFRNCEATQEPRRNPGLAYDFADPRQCWDHGRRLQDCA